MNHPLKNFSASDIANEMSRYALEEYVNISEKDGLTLYNYTNKTTYEKKWNLFTESARGLILDIKNNKIVAFPFPKFFNLSEVQYITPRLPFSVAEKYDGSLGIAWFYHGRWHVSTRGAFESEQAIWAQNYLLNHLPPGLKENTTYLFEIIYRGSRMVVPYPNEDMVLLGGYRNGTEEDLDELYKDFAGVESFYTKAKQHPHSSIDELLEVAKTLAKDKEGFVVRFSNGYRIKIKGAEYCRLHKIISNITPIGIWEILSSGMELVPVRALLPEEFYADFDQIVSELQTKYNEMVADVSSQYNILMLGVTEDPANQRAYKKQLAGLITKNVDKKYQGMMFMMNKGISISEQVWKTLRPDGNIIQP